MKGDGNFLLYLSAGAVELTWLYAWAIFITIPLVGRPFPLPEALGIFTLAALLTLVVRGRGWRVIMILGLHLLGLLLAASKLVTILLHGDSPAGTHWWLWEGLREPADPLAWICHVVVFLLVIAFWIGGVTLARRAVDYHTICARFDVGVMTVFCLLMIKFLVLSKGGPDMWGITPELLLFPLFLFGLLAIAMARNRGTAHRDFLAGYHAMGTILSATVVVLAFATGVVLLALPYLSAVADRGYVLLKSAAAPLGPLCMKIIGFLFGHHAVRLDTSFSPSEGTGGVMQSVPAAGPWGEIIETIATWGVLILAGAGVVLFVVFGLRLLFRWLFSRAGKGGEGKISWHVIACRLRDMWVVVCRCRDRVAAMVRGYRDAVDLYRGLCRWGRHSGIPHRHHETPREYGGRLMCRFPRLEEEIATIAEAFNSEVYGERSLDAGEFEGAGRAWGRMRSPRHWPCRWRSLFPGGYPRS